MSGLEIIFLSSSAITSTIGVFILLLNPRRLINRCYFASAGLSATWLFFVFRTINLSRQEPVDSDGILMALRIGNAAAGLLPLATFFIKESSVTQSIRQIFARSWPWLIGSCALTALAFSDTFYGAAPDHAGVFGRGIGYPLFLTIFAAMSCIILLESFREARTQRGLARMELQMLAVNLGLAGLAIILSFLVSTAFEILWLRYVGAFISTASYGLALWAVCYYRVFEAKQILALLGQRLILVAALGVAGSIVIRLLELLVPLAVAVPAVIALACWLALTLDLPFKRVLRLNSAEALHRARAETISFSRTVSDTKELGNHFCRLLSSHASADSTLLLLDANRTYTDGIVSLSASWPGLAAVCKEGWITPEALCRRAQSPNEASCLDFLNQHRLGALLAVPKGSPNPSLLVAIGLKPSLRPFTYPDLQFLIELAELMDNILTHAHVAARNAEIERMESAAMMSRGLAHDLNNLATPVSSFLVHMEGKVSPGTAEAEVLADAKHSVKVMQEYIRESLFFSRTLVPDLQQQSSAELFAATINSTQSRARSGSIELIVAPGPEITFAADRTLMLRLLQNLVFNGIDATPPGGRVTLGAAALDGNRVALTVADDGPGVPPEIADRIFEPYFTTKDTGSKTRGLGLGLAISLKIGALHGGTIHVGKAISGGALFTVTLPRSLPRPS